MKKVFITYGDQKYKDSLQKIKPANGFFTEMTYLERFLATDKKRSGGIGDF